MITVVDIEREIQDQFGPGEWFLHCLRDGGWYDNTDGTLRNIGLGDWVISIGTRRGAGYHMIKVMNMTDPRRYHYAADERLEFTADRLVLKNTVAYVLSKTTLLENNTTPLDT